MVGNELLGIVFLLIAGALTLLMYHAWGFPYDKDKLRSTAPRAIVWSHRLLGYVYVAIYLFMMWQMVPRLWTYQIELPARTVAHLLLGISIGALFLTKLVVVRFFRHLEAKLVPFLGTALFVCTVLLVSLALPVTLREAFLREAAVMGDTFSDERLERVRTQLPKAGLEDQTLLARLASSDGLMAGRSVLVNKCVQCHDLRTVLARPRTPEQWLQTVQRMSNRSTILNPISEAEQWQVVAYLVAISPTLQRTLRQKREVEMATALSQQAALDAARRMSKPELAGAPFDTDAARGLFETRCSQCHTHTQVDSAPPRSEEAAIALVMRMVRNGLAAEDAELETIIRYLTVTYAEPDASTPAPAPRSGAPNGDVSRTLIVQPAGEELRFTQVELEAPAGGRVKIVLENTATGLTHNWALVREDGALDAVIATAYAAGDRGYLPEHEAVIAGIPAIAAGASGEVVLVMPPPGDYPFLCLMPGHSFTMRGTLRSLP